MPEVRITMQPDVLFEVSEIEVADLRAQGLLVEPEAAPKPQPEAAPKPQPEAAPKPHAKGE